MISFPSWDGERMLDVGIDELAYDMSNVEWGGIGHRDNIVRGYWNGSCVACISR